MRVQAPDGTLIDFPDDMTEQQVRNVMRSKFGAPEPASTVTPGAGINGATKIEPRSDVWRDLQVGVQGVGKGVADLATFPFDMAAGAQNLVVGGVNKVLGTEIPMAIPASKLVEQGIDAVGVPTVPYDAMTSGQKVGYNINRFGTEALGGGAALAARAPAVAAAVEKSPTTLGRVFDHLARPYMSSPARTLVGDAVSGAGAGIGVTAADEFLPQEPTSTAGQVLKSSAQFLAPIAGGMSASTVQGIGEGIVGGLGNLMKRLFMSAPREIPLNPQTKAPYTIADTDRAARTFQGMAASPNTGSVAATIRENANELARPQRPGESPVAPSEMPTAGHLSRDPGLVSAETGARVRNGPAFVQRDQAVKGAAAERVASMRDPEANQGAVQTAAAGAREQAMQQPVAREQQFEDINQRISQQRATEGAAFAPAASEQARRVASERLDKAVVEDTYVPARTEKNRQFDNAPGRHEELPADEVFGAIDRIRRQANDLAPGTLPNDFIARLDRLRPRIDETTGENIGGPGTALGGDLADLRKFIGPAREQAQREGNFDLADNLGQLQSAINRTIDNAPGYADANANYRHFADRFRPEPGDEGAKFTREIDRGGQYPDGTLKRGDTPPSETAGRFLSGPEKAQSLRRMLAGAESEQAGNAAVRDYMRSDFALTALNPDGTLNPARAAAWARNNADVLSEFPAIRTEFDGYVSQAQRGAALSAEARRGLDTARTARKATEAEVDRGAIGNLLNEDPRDVASKLLSGGYGSERRLDEINRIVANDEAAKRGWRAAVSEVLHDRVQSTRKSGETYELQYARLAKEFKDNEGLLAKVYSPEDMNTLRQAHKLLEYSKEAEKRATIGSNTVDKAMSVPGWVQLAARHVWGDLKGGGIIKRFKLMLDLMPTNKQAADEIIEMAWFNPNVAAFLLERPVKDPFVPQYNVDLRRLMGAANAARESGPSEKK